jgi:hypothetical protein
MTSRRGCADFGLLKPIIRRQFILDNHLSYPPVGHGEDFAFYLNGLIAGGSFALFPEAYYVYTERSGSISGKASGISRSPANYAGMVQFTLGLAVGPEIRQDRRLTWLLRKRARRLSDLAMKNELRAHWRNYGFVAFGLLLCRNWRESRSIMRVAKNILFCYLSKALL